MAPGRFIYWLPRLALSLMRFRTSFRYASAKMISACIGISFEQHFMPVRRPCPQSSTAMPAPAAAISDGDDDADTLIPRDGILDC